MIQIPAGAIYTKANEVLEGVVYPQALPQPTHIHFGRYDYRTLTSDVILTFVCITLRVLCLNIANVAHCHSA